MNIKKLISYILLFAFLDQLTKILITEILSSGSSIPVVPGFFNLVLTYNRGVAFGFMSDWSEPFRLVVISLTSVMAFSLLIWMYVKTYRSYKLHSFAIALILGGAIGNIVDRVRYSAVVDFLDFHINTYHWPAFNVADSCICIGVFILLIAKE